MFSEIVFSDVFILGNLVAATCCQHFAVAHDIGPIADAERFAYIVIGDKDTHIQLYQMLDDVLNLWVR